MANPSGVTAGNTIEESWGDAVVSRVVGIYASLAAAEADGRTEVGALITLTDGSAWVKQSATALDWVELLDTGDGATQTLDGNLVIDRISDAWLRLEGGAALPDEPNMLAMIHWNQAGGSHDWYLGLRSVLGDDYLALAASGKDFARFHDSTFATLAEDTIELLAPAVTFYDSEAKTNARYDMHSDGRHSFYDEAGVLRGRFGHSTSVFFFRVYDDAGAIFAQIRSQADGGSFLDGSPLRGIRTGTAVPDNGDGNDGDIYCRSNATASNQGVYIKLSGAWVKIADHA